MPKFYKTGSIYFSIFFIGSIFLSGDLFSQIEKSVGINFNSCASTFVVHPKNEDFDTSLVDPGRIMMSSLHDIPEKKYYTLANTAISYSSIENIPAQTEDGKVIISVHLTPADENLGDTIYFKLFDPDDKSSYEINNTGNDNLFNNAKLVNENTGQEGNQVPAVTSMAVIDGIEIAIAQVTLDFTAYFTASGDNYIVKAGYDSNYELFVDSTDVLTLWRRFYVENDEMYRKGAIFGVEQVPPQQYVKIPHFYYDQDTLNMTQFQQGDEIRIFDKNSISDITTVDSVVRESNTFFTRIYISGGLANTYDQYGGVIKVGQEECYEPDFSLFTNAFGDKTDGTDGGIFVEYRFLEGNNNKIPYAYNFNTSSILGDFAAYWFGNLGNAGNIAHLLSIDDIDVDSSQLGARHFSPHDFINLNIGKMEKNYSSDTLMANVLNHEMGHLFTPNPATLHHIDTSDSLEYVPNHLYNQLGSSCTGPSTCESCIMFYGPIEQRYNSESEFDYNPSPATDSCIEYARQRRDPYNQD